ncbi:MAG: MFS transporter [Armatimonadota bacterium]
MSDDSAAPRIHPRIPPLVALVVGHAVSDGCINFIPPLWPEFQAKIGLTNTQIGVITGLVSITTNFGQPLFGYLADRFRIPHMVALGPAIVGLFVGLMALPEHAVSLGALYMIAGVGTALFHPQGATLAGRVAGSRRGLGMAIFSAGGAIGYGAGALVGVLLFERFGWPGMFGATFAGGLTAGALYAVHPGGRYPDTATEPMRLRTHVLPHMRKVGMLFAVVALRAMVIIVFTNFVALAVKDWGAGTRAGMYRSGFDEESLKRIAELTGGTYFHAVNSGILLKIGEIIDSLETREIRTAMEPKRTPYHRQFILAGFFLAALGFVIRKVFLREVLI